MSFVYTTYFVKKENGMQKNVSSAAILRDD